MVYIRTGNHVMVLPARKYPWALLRIDLHMDCGNTKKNIGIKYSSHDIIHSRDMPAIQMKKL